MSDNYYRRRIFASTVSSQELWPQRSSRQRWSPLCPQNGTHHPEIPFAITSGLMNSSMTPVSTIISAYHKCLEDDSLSGEALEGSADKVLPIPRPELQNGRVSTRAVTVWDPLFKMYHGELSQLPDTIP